MSDHRKVERRSLRYHEAIARRLLDDPAIVQRARERVEGWLQSGAVAPFYAQGWQKVLDLSTTELCSFLTDTSERSTAFRQVSPFAGALTPQERWRLWSLPDGEHDAAAT